MKPYIHKVKYYEVDKMSITHHSNYVRFMEEARVDLLNQIDHGFEKIEAEGVVSPVLSVDVKFIKPTLFQDEISIMVHFENTSPLKFTFTYEMKVDDVLVCTAKSVHCFMENNHPVVVAKRFPRLVEDLLRSNQEAF